jgi:hypothetical protein
MLLDDGVVVVSPIHAEGWVGEHQVELLAVGAVLGQRAARGDAAGVLTLYQHLGPTYGPRLRVQLLSVEHEPRLGIARTHELLHHREHPARSARRVVHLSDDAGRCHQVIVAR